MTSLLGRVRLAAVFLAAGVLMAVPAVAHAATWKEGTASRPFSLASAGGLIETTDTEDPSLVVPLQAGTVFDGTSIEFEPRSISVLPDGSMLVSCGKHGTIVWISKIGRLLRTFTSADIAGMQRPFDVVPTSDGGMLIVDRAEVQGDGRVFRVDASLNTVWQFGGTSGMGAGEVFDPFTAEQLAGGHTLISDSLGFRVIEVDDATGRIVWSYGEFKVSGSDAGHLNRPHSAQRLANGDTLICDSENQRVIEVDMAKRIVWSYGTGVAGSGPGQLANPNSSVRLANGDTLISDSDNARVLEVDASGRLFRIYGAGGITPPGGSLSDPRAALRLADGSTLIADLGNMRLASTAFPSHREFVATSSAIDPFQAARKEFTAIRVGASVPAGSMLAVEYSINSGAWTGLRGTALPSGTIGTNIRYRLRVTTGAGDSAPIIRDVSIDWVVAGASGSGTTNGNSGTHTAVTGNGAGSGSGTATSTAPGGSTDLPQGTIDGSTGTGGQAVGMSSTVSGWVMSEVSNDVLDPGTAGTSGPGTGGRPSSDSTTPGLAVLLAFYAAGIFWAPTARLASAAFSRIVTAVLPR